MHAEIKDKDHIRRASEARAGEKEVNRYSMIDAREDLAVEREI